MDLTSIDRIKNVFNQAFNIAKRKRIALTPMDSVFNLMSKARNFKGAVFMIFKRTADKAKKEYNRARSMSEDKILNAVKDLNITKNQRERILVFAELRQDFGREKLIASGFSEKSLAEFEKTTLTENETKLLDIITTELEKVKPLLLEIQKRVYNKDFTSIKDYFPMLTDFSKMEESEMQNRFGADATLLEGVVSADQRLKKNIRFSALEERKGGAVAIKLDAVDVAIRHLDNAYYFITHAQALKELGELANSKEYGDAVGNIGQQVTREWVDLLVRKGRAAGNRVKVFDILRKHTTWAVLGFKISSTLIQPTSFLDGAAQIGGNYVSKGVINVATSPEWRKFLKENFIEVQVRVADDAAFAEFMEHGADAPIVRAIAGETASKALKKLRIGSFWGLRKLDGIAATSVAAGAYEKIVTEKGGIVDFSNPDEEAILDAELIVRRTQSSSDFKDAPSAITLGKFTGNISLDRLIFQFQSFMLTRFAQITDAFAHQGFHLKPTQESINVATWLMLAIIAELGIKRGIEELMAVMTDDDDLEDFSDIALEKFVKELVRTIPVAGQVLSSLNYGNVSVPVISLFEQGIKEYNISTKTKDYNRKRKHVIRAILILTGEIGGIPGTLQIDQIIRKTWKIEKKKSSKSLQLLR